MIKPILSWKSNNGVGSVKFPSGFDEQNWVIKSDALNDWIVELTEKYNSLMGAPVYDASKSEGHAVAIAAISLLEGHASTGDHKFLSAAIEILREFDASTVHGTDPKMSANLQDCLGRMIHGDAVGGA